MRGQFSSFRKRLLQWFEENKRPLPWRTDPSLYKTVISEFMLQQTQVETVLPYFARWLEAFPDFHDLAAAPEERVLKRWEGLGYYARARNLHKLAKSIVTDGVPASAAQWRDRPGIGPYTAAAISSIAQNAPEAVVDGNVVRVLARLLNDNTPIRSSTEAHKRFAPLAGDLLDPQQPGAFNEAMMELGATVCRKTRPACLLCPVQTHCTALREGNPETLPVIVRKQTQHRSVNTLWARDGDRLLLYFHPAEASRLAGLAELPRLREAPGTPPLLTRSRGISAELIREHIFALPGSVSPEHASTLVDHPLQDLRWIALGDLDTISLSAPHRRWIHDLLRHEQA